MRHSQPEIFHHQAMSDKATISCQSRLPMTNPRLWLVLTQCMEVTRMANRLPRHHEVKCVIHAMVATIEMPVIVTRTQEMPGIPGTQEETPEMRS
jgi:hypothetical protein